MSQKNSDIIHSSASIAMNLFRKGLMHGAGYNTDRLKERPLIAIANSHSEMTTGHAHLDRLARKVKEGIIAAGGECAEFNVPAPCDGIAMAHDGMRYILAQRDLIADMVETHMRSQPFDAMVMIAGCDKINPAMMMAAGRLDLPAIYLAGGPGQMDIRNSQGNRNSIDHGDYQDDVLQLIKSATCSTCGACEIMGTANTFQCLAEAMGICLPGSSNIPGWHSDKLEVARATGERIVEMFNEGLNFRQIMTKDSIQNAVTMAMAIDASTNTVLHLPAVAEAAGGMPEMLGVTMALKEKGLKETALITDGRFSGATSGPCVGHICPEASDGGLIAFIEDGDLIEIDIPNNSIHLDVSDEVIAERKKGWTPLEKEVPQGYMRRYRKHVRPACEGAILD